MKRPKKNPRRVRTHEKLGGCIQYRASHKLGRVLRENTRQLTSVGCLFVVMACCAGITTAILVVTLLVKAYDRSLQCDSRFFQE